MKNRRSLLFSSLSASLCVLIAILFSCTSNQENTVENKTETVSLLEEETEEIIDAPIEDQTLAVDSFELDNEIPFKYPCESSFKFVGVIKVSDSHWEEIQLGKGWDSRRHACTFTWGEHIYNNIPPDTITDFRMHLVDLDSTEIDLSPEFLNSKRFKDNLIVTTVNGKTDLVTTWDPSGTGKYPKPKHWLE